MRKKRNIYFVNTVNIQKTVNTVNTANNKNNILIYLTLPMDRSLPVESTPQIDLKNTRDEDVGETLRKGYIDYSERNFTDLFNIPDHNNIDEDQHSSCLDIESDPGTNVSEADEVPPKKGKRENNSKWSATKPKSKLKRRSVCDIMKGTPGPRLDARLVKNEFEAFLLNISENMMTKIVERTNEQMRKLRRRN